MDVYKGTTTKFDVPLDHLDFQYVKKCTNAKELEKIVRVLRYELNWIHRRCIYLTITIRLCTLMTETSYHYISQAAKGLVLIEI